MSGPESVGLERLNEPNLTEALLPSVPVFEDADLSTPVPLLGRQLIESYSRRLFFVDDEVCCTRNQSCALSVAPGRICLAGESLDWMIGGPSIVGAIDLYLGVGGLISAGGPAKIMLHGLFPFDRKVELALEQIGNYTRSPLDYLHAAVSTIRDVYRLTLSNLEIRSLSDLPTRAGVSSSAAVTLATVSALGNLFNLKLTTGEVCKLAYRVEREELKTGAGQMDFYACGLGGMHYLKSGNEPPAPLIGYPAPRTEIILVDTMLPHPDKTLSSSKRTRFAEGDPLISRYLDEAPRCVEAMRTLLPNFDGNVAEIGAYVTEYQRYLREYLLSSTDLIDACVRKCLNHGAYGAKLTGSGMGGCMFALAPTERVDEIAHALRSFPVKVHVTKFSESGIRSARLNLAAL